MEANFEILLQQSNTIKNFIKDKVVPLDSAYLLRKADEKSWSVLEVIKHLNLVYDKYLVNLENAVANAEQLQEGGVVKKKTTILGSISVYSQRPKGNKRKFKMKTFDFFEPEINNEELHQTLDDYYAKKNRFNEILRESRLKNLENVKIPTALGERVQFYFYQCLEFLIAHEQRHVVQIKNILSLVKTDSAGI